MDNHENQNISDILFKNEHISNIKDETMLGGPPEMPVSLDSTGYWPNILKTCYPYCKDFFGIISVNDHISRLNQKATTYFFLFTFL